MIKPLISPLSQFHWVRWFYAKEFLRILKGKSPAFTLIEIMIVVAIIGVIVAIAIPNYLDCGRRAQRNACLSNLRTLEQAIEQRKLSGEVQAPTMEELCEPIGYIKGIPRCPASQSADYDLSGEVPVCPNVLSFPDHVLP